ncbi:MAG: HNH endonuclease [Elusimicrobia bacterium]|nr:HNH endonuclease [Elusimicrobiota bacterium]
MVELTKNAALLAVCVLAKRTDGGCAWCGKPLPAGRRKWCAGRCETRFWNNHWWPRARRAARRRDKHRCARCGAGRPLEVNHKTPCRGLHAALACAHHLDNLETLCVPCHREHTAALPRVSRGREASSARP